SREDSSIRAVPADRRKERWLEHAVDPNRVAEKGIGIDAMVVGVVEPIRARRDVRFLAERFVPQEEALVAARTKRDEVIRAQPRRGLGVAVNRAMIVGLEAEDIAAADLDERKALDEREGLREVDAGLAREVFAKSAALLAPISIRDELVEHFPGE